MPTFTKILWLELIGFDNALPDFGVSQFLADMPVKPDAVSLLLWDPEIIHAHTDLNNDQQLGPKQCAYGARLRNEDRTRQDWTKFQLRSLVAQLQKHGVSVFISVFDQHWGEQTCKARGIPWKPEWLDLHPEVRYTFSNGNRGSLCPWKHIGDGSLYEDFFTEQLKKVILDYGFDGFHCADGFAHPRDPINQGDFSDDMIEQFADSEHISVPALPVPERAQWILKNARHPWTRFHCRRHAQFCGKIVAMLNGIGKGHVFNSCWTRSPIEAILRYGVDYAALARAGVRNIIVEATTSVLETEGWNYNDIPKQDDHRAMLMQLKAYVPDCTLFMLHGVKDGMEQYNSLRHCPPFMESDACALINLLYDEKRILQGMTVCLADAIRPDEWSKLDEIYTRNFSIQPAGQFFPTVLWSADALARELKAYEFGRATCNSHEFHARLLAAGAVLPAMTTPDRLQHGAATPVVLINPAFYSDDERRMALEASNGNAVLVGLENTGEAIFRLFKDGQLLQDRRITLTPPENPDEEILTWLRPLPERLPDRAELAAVAKDINDAFAPCAAQTTPDLIRLWGFICPDGDMLLFVGNEKMTYHRGNVILKGDYALEAVLAGNIILPPSVEAVPEGTRLFVKLPPHGTLMLKLKKRP